MKWCGGWGAGDDVNKIIRYLLEETGKYKRNYSHFLYTRGSDCRLFNSHVSTIEDLGKFNKLKNVFHLDYPKWNKETLHFVYFYQMRYKSLVKRSAKRLIWYKRTLMGNKRNYP